MQATATAFDVPKYLDALSKKPLKKYLVTYSVDVYVDAPDDDQAVERGWAKAQTEFEPKAYASLKEIKGNKY